MAKSKIDGKKIRTPLEKAFRKSMFKLGRGFTEVISDPNAFEGFPSQDLVDTGRLRASQRVTFPDIGRARFSWPVEYAKYLITGWEVKGKDEDGGDKTTKIEGRDWISEGIRRAKIEEDLKEQIRKEMNG